jgi:formylglycine-generating enzyme required for sulfatase activity
VSLSRRLCLALGAVCLGAGLVTPWAAARVSEGEVVPVVETVRLRPALVRLPGGSFLMGSQEYAEEDERPQRLIEVPALSLCQTEVTQGQYAAVMGVNPSYCEYGCGDELPVQTVSWVDAVAYLNKLTVLESEALVALGEAALTACYEGSGDDVAWVEGCTGYRLPTEAEWEYAARAGTTTRWSFGDEQAELGEYAWYDGNAEVKVHTVGTKKANPWGLSDMHGNVWEWVWDAYDSYKSDKVVNSTGSGRALHGGSFYSAPWDLRSADRNWLSPGDRFRHGGFRCARGAGPQR